MSTHGNEIAVVGLSGRFPGASSVDALWRILANGEEPIRDLSQDADDPRYSPGKAHMVHAHSAVADADLFDAAFFGINPREAETLDPQHRIFLECAWEALEGAGLRVGDKPRAIGVFSGAGMTSYGFGQIPPDAQILEAFPTIIANDKDFVSTRISYKLDLTGPSLTLQCACSTSLAAVHMACQSLIAGECDAAVAGGVAVAVPQREDYLYLPGGMLSPDGRNRAFDASGHGTVFTEGAGVIALMRLDDALAGGFPVRAVIRGTAINNDGGAKPGYTAPTVDGQVQVIRSALAAARLSARDIGYLEAHGTGTLLGDAVELGALTEVFRADSDEVGFCDLGSVKSNIGHTLAAAGAVSVIKAVLALEHRARPGLANFTAPNPDLDLATSPFHVHTDLQPWEVAPGQLRRAGVSSFGVGGTNVHVILEEAPARTSAPSTRTCVILPLSARSPRSLDGNAAAWAAALGGLPFDDLADAAHTAQLGRRAFEYRRVAVAETAAEARALLEGSGPSDNLVTGKAPAAAPRLAFLFSGQGAQYPGMGAALYAEEPLFRAAVDECLAALSPETAERLRTLVFSAQPGEGAEQALKQTELTQLALFVLQHAMAETLKTWRILPSILIGHSIGEYAAAVQAGVLSLADALAVVATRGRLMGEMPAGAMLSIALPRAALPPLGEGIDLASVNAPNLCVVAGPVEAIARLERTLSADGIGCRRLQTSHAFHSAMMAPMLEAFSACVAAVPRQAPVLPCVSSLTGRVMTADEVADPAFWARQIRQPVLFAEGIETVLDSGATVLVEIGPGRSLSTLVRQCAAGRKGIEAVQTLPEPRLAHEQGRQFARALGRLWVAGVDIDWAARARHEQRRRLRLPTYAFDRQRYWVELDLARNATPAAGKLDDPARWLHVPSWRQRGPAAALPRAAEPQAERQTVLVIGGRDALSAAMVAEIAATGDRALQVVHGPAFAVEGERCLAVAWAEPASWAALAQHLAEGDALPHRLVHLGACAELPALAPESLGELLAATALGLANAVKALQEAAPAQPLAVHIVTTGLFDVTGQDPLRPEASAMLSLQRVLPQELRSVTTRLIDVDALAARGGTPDAARRIHAALQAAGAGETVQALRHRRLWTLGHAPIDPAPADPAAPGLTPQGVYLVTGGLGKVGLVFARFLAEHCQARLVLTGRSALPPRSEFARLLADPATGAGLRAKLEAIEALEALGARVMTPAVDVANAPAMAELLAEVARHWGPLNGVVHCAGVTTVGRLAVDSTLDTYQQNYASKVFGLQHLDRLLAGQALDLAVVVSSISAVLGGLGHLAYAAANATADALVHDSLARGGSLPWKTLNFDAWKFEAGEIDTTQAMLNTLDFAMTADEGRAVIALAVATADAPQIVIATSPLQARLKAWVEDNAVRQPESECAQGQYQRPDIDTPFVEPDGPIEVEVAAIWRRVLGLNQVGRDDDFFAVGGHSLLAIELLSHFRTAFGVEFPVDRAMEATTVRRTAAVIVELIATRDAARAAVPA